MTHRFTFTLAASLVACGLLLSGCGPAESQTGKAPVPAASAVDNHPASAEKNQLILSGWQPQAGQSAESWQWLPTGSDFGQIERAAADSRGLWLLSAQGEVQAHLPGRFATLDLRPSSNGLTLATVDSSTGRPMLVRLNREDLSFGEPLYLPTTDYKVENLCLYRDEVQNLFVFLIGEEGIGEQWLVASNQRLLESGLPVRRLSLPPESEFCAVDDQQHLLYVNEESVGVWAYGAHPEAELSRTPIDMVAPFGDITGSVAGLSSIPGGLLVLDAESAQLHRYQQIEDGWSALPAIALSGLEEPERISARPSAKSVELLLVNDGAIALHTGELHWQPEQLTRPTALPVLLPLVHTDPVPTTGDAADDPAIWVNPAQPELSRVLGTDKRAGLGVYDLQGKELQFLPVGRLNNVDLRYDFAFAGQTVDLAVASNRDGNSLHLFAIDQSSGELTDIGQIPTSLDEIYGLCMSQSPQGEIYAIPNDKDGRFQQYHITAEADQVRGELVREFATQTQPEGCVADDQRQTLFIGEEDVAVWALDASADAPTTLHKVVGIGGLVKDDIEGLAFYQHAEHPYLVISSQGNDSFVVFDGQAPYALRGAFRVGLNAESGIDGVSETDGLEISSDDLGGPWSRGLLVVQDGRKRMPEGNQNYKYVAWQDIAEALNLD
ncbi:phytase [Halopseudomonas pelagia]|uniref:phytase n=1 Tax=Halopseudomonas pelagia TaxID=553151 RepID=UPI0003A1621A|nr:phytase [Halopseudomonas pelagia]|tara:strand:+ start:114579 stop:116573 length:1995 start_codon:yes stop_codon:yes gene_type:complete